MKRFLTLKHWQLFLLFIGVPIIFQFIATVSIVTSINPTDTNPIVTIVIFPIMMVLFIGLLFGWLYSVGVNLYKKLPVAASMNIVRFKFFLFIPVVYMLLLLVFMFGMSSNTYSGGQADVVVLILILPLHLFSMFCIFYCLYFNAKVLKAVELQRPVTFGDFAGEFFLIWFFPIGVWIIQPRINKLIDVDLNHNVGG